VAGDELRTVTRLLRQLLGRLRGARREKRVDLAFEDIHAHVHVVVGEHALQDDGDGIPRFVHRQEDDHRGGDGAPREGDANPKVEVTLVEHTAACGGAATRREREDRPEDNHDEGEANAPLLDPRERGLELLRIGIFILFEFRKLVVDELNAIVQRAEVKVLRILEGHERVDDARGANGDDVTGEHRVVFAERLDGDRLVQALSGDDPRDQAKNLAADGADDGTLGVRLVPSQNERDGHDGGADEDAHHEVHETEGQSKLVEDQGEDTHENTEGDDTVTRHAKDVFTRGVRFDVLAVHIVRKQGGDGNLLGGARGHDGHEEHDGDRSGTTLTHQVGGDGGRHETLTSFVRGDRQVESDGGETHGGGEGEGDGEPNETAEEVTLGGGARLGRDGGLPVRLVDENGTEVTDDVDDTEDDTTLREHGQVRALLVFGHRTAVLVGGKASDAFG